MTLDDKYLAILSSNQRSVKGFRYTVPSSSAYPYQWLWDSCFHSIIYTKFGELDCAKDEIRSLLSAQWENGMIPHMVYWVKPDKHNLQWGTDKNTSSITQPPMIAYAVRRIYEANKDKEFIREVFDRLDKYYRWLHTERSDNYVLSIIHPWESGEDDLVCWDSVYGVENPSREVLRKCKLAILDKYIKSGLDSREFMRKNIFNVKCLMFNSVYLKNLYSMLCLAKVINSAEAKYYENIVPKVERSHKTNLHNKDTGLYSSYYSPGEKHYLGSSEDSSIFLPFFSGILANSEARKLVNDFLLNDNKFWTKYPVPTVSIDAGSFQPNRYWRGSTWINMNWFICKGLKEYGIREVAETLKDRSLELVKKSGFFEYFNPIDGRGLGASNFSWSGLVFDM